jgi:formyltetrahydrofolate hydrolase
MDNQRPQLDLRFYKNICPDQNGVLFRTSMTVFNHHFEVPVIAVFTKYDQFLRNVEMHLVDYPDEYCHLDNRISQVAEHRFQEQYLHSLSDDARFVRLESRFSTRCHTGYVLRFFDRNAQRK